MRASHWLAVAAMAACLCGCGKTEEDVKDKVRKVTDDVKQHVADALDVASRAVEQATNYAFDKKDEFQSLVTKAVTEAERQAAEMKIKAESAADDVKEGFQKELDKFEARKAETQRKLDALKTIGEDAWDSAKADLVRLTSELKQAADNAASKLP